MRLRLVVPCVLLAACGSSTPPTSPPPSNPNTITITTAGGANPKEMTVAPGTRVLFVNQDSIRHDMASDQHPDHRDCPEINAVGVLNPGQSRETGNLVTVRTCGFHDHDNPDRTALQGRIVIR
jgi:plastocyanin